MRNDRGIQQAVETHARDVNQKRLRHINVVILVKQLQAQSALLQETMYSLERAACGTLLGEQPDTDPDYVRSLRQQVATIKEEIALTKKSLSEAEERATVRLQGWDAHVASCLSVPGADAHVDDEDEENDQESDAEKFERDPATLIIMHQAHADVLAEYYDEMELLLIAMQKGDDAARKKLAAIVDDLHRKMITGEHVENAANRWRAAIRTSQAAVRLKDENAFRYTCYGPSLFDRRPSAVVDHFMNLHLHPIAHAAHPNTARASTHRAPARTRRAHAGHGATAKSGDDGDGDGGDGEPPRPRTSNAPTLPLHHSLTTHSLIFAGGAQ